MIVKKYRWYQAAELLTRNMSNKDIAAAMGVSTRTVKAYLREAYLRYGITSGSKRVHLVRYIIKESHAATTNVDTARN